MLMRPTLLTLASGVAIAACSPAAGDTPEQRTAAPTPVRVAAVSRETIAPPVIATGTLGPKEAIALSFKIGGVVSSIRVDAGATVAQGDLLAALDPVEIDAAVTRAQSAAEKADRDLERARRLYRDSVFTLAQLQDATTGAEVAAADLRAALFNRRHAVIVAPGAGVILERQAEPGELVASGRMILSFGSRARGAVVRVGLADRDVVRVQQGDRAVVQFDALPGREWTGRVTEIAAAAEPATGTYAVEIALPGAAQLASGLVGRVEIRPSGGRPADMVPIEALLEADGDSGTVYGLSTDGSRAERRRVTVAFISHDRIAVARGLEGVSQVITAGAAYLSDGAAVKAVP